MGEMHGISPLIASLDPIEFKTNFVCNIRQLSLLFAKIVDI